MELNNIKFEKDFLINGIDDKLFIVDEYLTNFERCSVSMAYENQAHYRDLEFGDFEVGVKNQFRIEMLNFIYDKIFKKLDDEGEGIGYTYEIDLNIDDILSNRDFKNVIIPPKIHNSIYIKESFKPVADVSLNSFNKYIEIIGSLYEKTYFLNHSCDYKIHLCNDIIINIRNIDFQLIDGIMPKLVAEFEFSYDVGNSAIIHIINDENPQIQVVRDIKIDQILK